MSLDSYFRISQNNSTITREINGGITTFITLSYIIFVQPAVMNMCGMDRGAVMIATCICSALACFAMGLMANLPIALAPAMGHNFFFALTVCGTMGYSWQEALSANFIAGILFLLLSICGVRKIIMQSIPESLKFAIAAGIGLLIAMIGLEWSGIVVSKGFTYITIGNISNPVTLLSVFGLLLTAVLISLKLRGAILIGMIITAGTGYLATHYFSESIGYNLVSTASSHKTPEISATAGKIFTEGFASLFSGKHAIHSIILIIFTFLLLDIFDTIGTLVGLTQRAGLLKDGKIPKANQAMAADAIGTLSGTIMGTSTITSYVESSAGIAAGARTGLAAIVTGILMLLGIFAYPLLGIFGTKVEIPASELGSTLTCTPEFMNTVSCYPVVAPVLIIIGCYMLPVIKRIDWDDFSQALPAFLTIIIMQCSFSITDGIAWGFISYSLIKLFTGKAKTCPLTVYICSILFITYYVYR